MTYLIDGYNLMHALGVAPRPGSPSLEKARLRLIDWLALEKATVGHEVCVVFDARTSTGCSEKIHRGIYMLFTQGETADDLMEKLIREENDPPRMSVVSNDHRILTAARRKGCPALSCGDYVDELQGNRSPTNSRPSKAVADKPESPTDDEMSEWLRKFNMDG